MIFEDLLHQIIEKKFSEYSKDNKWHHKKFQNIISLPYTQRGKCVENFLNKVCEELNFETILPDGNQSPWDIKINKITFELKSATEDTSGKFQFNHIRYHRPYQALICIGVSPSEIFFGTWTKADVTTGLAGKLVSMEAGANASFKLTKAKKDLFSLDKLSEKLKLVISSVKT